MTFNKRKYIPRLLSSRKIDPTDTTEIKISIVEVFNHDEPVTVELQVLAGAGRSPTEVLAFTAMTGEAPIFSYSGTFASILESSVGKINIKITDANGNPIYLDDGIEVEFVV